MINIKIGDSRELIHKLDNSSIDCIMTSPPYYGLRDYGHDNQIGLEKTPEEYLNKLVGLFSDIQTKLKDSGNCFVNIGDTYSGSGKGAGSAGSKESWTFDRRPAINENLPAKCLCMIPERFAWQMIETGWILRNKIIWYKPNHMPESVTDRLTKSYEVVYHFVKSQKYYYDLDAIRDPYKIQESDNNPLGKNPGDVWQINTHPYPEAHFAVYPIELIRKPILAGCPVGGIVLDPFGGSGATAEFCRKNQRNCILFELNPDYESLIKERAMVNIPELTEFKEAVE